MIIFAMKVEIDIRGVRSLKEKRQVRLRIIDRLRHHYKLSIKEIENQDSLKTLVLGISEVLLKEFEGEQKKEKYLQEIEAWIEFPISNSIWDIMEF